MSVEELVKEAHKAAQWDDSPSQILLELADKLEELAAENERLKEYSEVVTSKYKRLVHETGPAIIERAEKAEASLAEVKRENEALREKAHNWSMEADKYKRALDRYLARNAGGKDA